MLVDPADAERRAAHAAFRRAAKRGPTRGSRRGSASRSAIALAVGEATLTVGAIVQQEPEVASGLLALGPRLLHQHRRRAGDEPAAAGQSRDVAPARRRSRRRATRSIRISTWLQAELKPGQRMENVRDLRPEVRQTLERAEQFLGLAALVAVILAAVAVALAASRYLRRHLDTAAMLRCFGAPRRQALALFVLQFAVLGARRERRRHRARARAASSCW